MANKFNSSRINEFVSTDLSLFILRFFAAGFMLFGHGWGKMMNVISGNFQFGDPIGLGPEVSLILAAFAEGICAIFIIIGCYTRAASLILMINMAVAFLFVHLGNDPFGGMEKALLYLLIFTVIFLMGPGKFAFDSKSRR